MSKNINYRKTANSVNRKRFILESCMVKLMRMSAILYNNDLANPFPERFNQLDPYELVSCLNRLKRAMENLHIDLIGEEECISSKNRFSERIIKHD